GPLWSAGGERGLYKTVLVAVDVARCTGRDLEAGVVGTVRLGLATAAHWRATSALLDLFTRNRPAVEISIVESYGGALSRELRDGRLDAVLAPSIFGSADLCGVDVGSEPWMVLVGRRHRLAGEGPLHVDDLQGEEIVITGHRDGAAYDRAVADTLTELGVTPVLRRGGPGPALFAAVAQGDALALTTAPDAVDAELLVRPLDPGRALGFELLWGRDTPSPALTELIRAAEEQSRCATPASRPALRAVA
ncbi:MAG: LysR substrate-binding domain-containing protein, partial [Solirubrobacteraceae bacterium]